MLKTDTPAHLLPADCPNLTKKYGGPDPCEVWPNGVVGPRGIDHGTGLQWREPADFEDKRDYHRAVI